MCSDGSADIDHVISGCKFSNDIQEMELMAVIVAIRSVPKKQPVEIYTDHKTICDVLAKTERAQCERGRNRSIWNQLRQLCQSRDITLRWVKSHAGIPGNCAADHAAKFAARSLIPRPAGIAQMS
jgi:ribonuclease HI